MKDQIWKQITTVKKIAPLVHSITNFVVMNNTANALLAAGASPIMAHCHAEMEDMVSISGALVINIGTLDEYWVQSMRLAINQANKLGKPWVLDPVGAGASPYRNEVLQELTAMRPTVIRGNASEIMALAKWRNTQTKGVDSTHESDDAIAAAKMLAHQFGSVVCISGATDIIIYNAQIVKIQNGSSLMQQVTGMGCTATALIGAFVSVDPNNAFLATASAMALMGVAGEIAAKISAGPGSLQLNLLDTLYNLEESDFMSVIKLQENADH